MSDWKGIALDTPPAMLVAVVALPTDADPALPHTNAWFIIVKIVPSGPKGINVVNPDVV